MKTKHSPASERHLAETRQAVEARLGLRLAAALTEREPALPADISERLRVAREQAVARARQARLAAKPASSLQHNGNGTATLSGPPSFWLRWASLVPLLTLVLGLVAIDEWHTQAQIHAAAEVDSDLLGDSLPPEAYRDPGFLWFLRGIAEPAEQAPAESDAPRELSE